MNFCHLSSLISQSRQAYGAGQKEALWARKAKQRENWQNLSWTQASDHIQKTWGDGFEQGDLSLGWTISGILSIPRTCDKQALSIYLEVYSMLSRKGWFPVSGTKEEKHKATMQQRQQKNIGSCVLIWL